jgi:hypothetical protein
MKKNILRTKYDEIIERLKKEGRVSTFQFTEKQEKDIDDSLAEYRRKNRYNQALSQIEANRTIICE